MNPHAKIRLYVVALGVTLSAALLNTARTQEPATPTADDADGEKDTGEKDTENRDTEKRPAASADPEFEQLLKDVTAHIERVDSQNYEVPDFPEGKDWFNSRPLSFKKELRGKIVILDFWTYCCINCIHVLPDLAWLEHKYAGYPVAFVGVHSAKFENEKLSSMVRDAVLRYEIAHPVINDDEMFLWRQLQVSSWPTLMVVGPKGNLLVHLQGEGHRRVLDAIITAALRFYPEETFGHDPLPMRPETDVDRTTSPLRYPGKLAIDDTGKRLFISDSNHHRIVVTSADGAFQEVIGSGEIGLRDGSYGEAQFNRLQGLAYYKNRLYVADAENHALRVVDLEAKTVATLAGTGVQGYDRMGGGLGPKQILSTPWDVIVHEERVLIAMAGTHQIWTYDLKSGIAENFSGTGRELNLNGEDRLQAAWAQPSGLSIGMGELFVADSESSTIRSIDLKSGTVRGIVGGDDRPRNLFAFGDRDGVGMEARLQHALGVLWLEDEKKVVVADTYNHRLKMLDPEQVSISAWVGSGKPGLADGKGLEAQFSEPSGLALSGDGKRIFVADANNHAIRVVDRASLQVETLQIKNVPPPRPPVAPRSTRLADLPGTKTVRLAGIHLKAGGAGRILLKLQLPAEHHYTEGAESRWQILADEKSPLRFEEASAAGPLGVADVVVPFTVAPLTAAGSVEATLRVEALAYYCKKDGACRLGSVLFEVPVKVSADGSTSDIELSHAFDHEAALLR